VDKFEDALKREDRKSLCATYRVIEAKLHSADEKKRQIIRDISESTLKNISDLFHNTTYKDCITVTSPSLNPQQKLIFSTFLNELKKQSSPVSDDNYSPQNIKNLSSIG
jgi:hypothetical protein